MLRRLFLLSLVFVAVFAFSGAFATEQNEVDPKLNALAQKRLELAEKGYAYMLKMYKADQVRDREVIAWARACLDSRRGAVVEKTEQLSALREYVDRLKALEEHYIAARKADPRGEPSEGGWTIPYHRVEAEYWLAQATAR